MKPTLAPRPADPIDIDPGVAFRWVIAAQGATSFGYTPNKHFSVDQDGKTLDITCTAALTAAAQIFTLMVFASNKEGTVYQKLNFRIRAAEHLITTWWPVETLAPAGSDVFFNAISPGSPIGDNLAVDWKVKFSKGAWFNPAPGGENFPENIFFVKSIGTGGKKFKVALTSGGAAIVEDGGTAYGEYYMSIATCLSGSDLIYVRDSSKFAVNDPINLQYSDGSLLPPELRGPLFVKTIVNDCYIKVAAAVGGAAIVATEDSFATPPNPLNANSFPPAKADPGVNLISDNLTRQIPSITSDDETDVELLDPVAYTPTTDIAADQFEYQGLAPGLELVDDETGEVTGNVSAPGFYPILILAYKGDSVAYRYWLLIVGGDTGRVLLPDAIYDVISKRFYMAAGPAGRADRLERVLGDPSILFGFEQLGEPFEIPAGATVRVRAKKKLNDGTDLVLATKVLSTATSQVQVGEDWNAGALAALLAEETKYVDLYFWFEWRLATDTAGQYRRSYPTAFRVWRSDDLSFAPTAPAFFIQDKPFTLLTGGTAAALNSVATAGLALDTWLARVIRTIDGTPVLGEWFLVAWDTVTAAADEATSADRGIVIPADFNAGTNAKQWVRVSGL